MRARGAVPQTDAEKRERRAQLERGRERLPQHVPQLYLDALFSVRHDLRHEKPRVVHAFGAVCMLADMPCREHDTVPGHFSFDHNERDGTFGYDAFARLNAKHHIIDVVPCNKKRGVTNAYRLVPDVADAIRDAMARCNQDLSTAVHMFDRSGRRVGKAKAGKGFNTQRIRSFVGESRVLPCSVDLEALVELRSTVERVSSMDVSTRRPALVALGFKETSDPMYWHAFVNSLLIQARLDIFEHGVLMHEYTQVQMGGRLVATGVNLQSAARPIRDAALNGLFDYDIRTCHASILAGLASLNEWPCSRLPKYVDDPDSFHESVASRCGLTAQQVKNCVRMVLYGASIDTNNPEHAIPDEIGLELLPVLRADDGFRLLEREVKTLGKRAVKQATTAAGRIVNVLGLECPPHKQRPAEKLSHVLTGYEVRVLLAIVRSYHEDVAVLVHDGFVARKRIDVKELEAIAHDATEGLRLRFKERQLEAPRSLL